VKIAVFDGIFFSDGEFAGPNEGQLWEHIVSVSEAYQEVTRVAREQFERASMRNALFPTSCR
jgi:hypothetical protein